MHEAPYKMYRFVLRALLLCFLGLRVRGTGRVPARGGFLLASNHQSFLDPLVVACAVNRPVRFLARSTLWNSLPYRWFARSLGRCGPIPVDRDRPGPGAMREIIRLLRKGEVVLVFPEGTRTSTGRLGPLRPGTSAIARRADVPVVPMYIDGTYDAWSRHRPLPRPARVAVRFGAPLAVGERDGDEAFLRALEGSLTKLESEGH